MLRSILATIGMLAAALAATPAAAQLSQTIYEGQSIPLTIPVTASVGGRCQFATNGAPSGTWDAGFIDEAAWQHDFGFTLECNTAARVAVVSLNGGLKAPVGGSDPGYVNLAPYTVTLNLDGNTTTASDFCAAAALKASAPGTCAFRGPASTTAGLRLAGPSQNQTDSYLRVSAPAFAGPGTLVASTAYADTLTITIAAAP
ncbi:hypothetical protein [Tsuneonella deserti]|uniref:hypothetical protein n=1 Tax=Tsuneonella deserti TaxID=2035528 RepID=UPI00166629A5|nr:hypothetical protein [Tsuneonella deserti]